MFEIAPVAAIVNLKESIVAGSTVPVSVAPAQLNKKKFQPAFTAVASDCVVCAVGVQYLVVKSFPQINVAEVKAETEPTTAIVPSSVKEFIECRVLAEVDFQLTLINLVPSFDSIAISLLRKLSSAANGSIYRL